MTMFTRNNLAESQEEVAGPHVYVTDGHYTYLAEQVVEYVRRGGNLLLAGQAWFWASQQDK